MQRIKEGHIKAFVGPVKSRKTAELLIELDREVYAEQNIQLFKPAIDDRDSITQVVSRSGMKRDCIVIDDLIEIFNWIDLETDVVGFDEAMLFPTGLVEVIIQLACQGKKVVVSGNDMNHKGQGFRHMPEILAISEEVVKLKAVCVYKHQHSVCGQEAAFSYKIGYKIGQEDSEIEVGHHYEPMCRKHWLESITP